MNDRTDFRSKVRIAVALVTLLALSTGAATVTATDTEATAPADATAPPEEAVVVSLHENGDADVSLVTTFNLTADAEKRAFERLKENETKRRQLRQRFTASVRQVVSGVQNQTDRDMAVENSTVTVTTAENGTTGVFAVSVTWTNLAAERGDALVVEEPFASGFDVDRAFVLRAPDGYGVAELTPKSDSSIGRSAVWAESSSLDGFRAVLEPNETDGGTTRGTSDATTADGSSGSTPGFGIGGAFAALVAIAALAARR